MTGFDGWDWPAADAERMTEPMFDENARLRGLDPRHKDDGTVALTAGGRTVEARPDGHGGWNIPAEDPDDPDAHAAGDGDLLDLAALRTGAVPCGLPLSD